MTALPDEGNIFLNLEGIRFHCRLDGPDQGRPMIFVNSLGSDLRIWDTVVEMLSDTFCTLRYDKRGHGLSETPQTPYRLGDHTRDLSLILEWFDYSDVVVVGISVGGMIAMDLANREQNKVSLLVLADTGATIGTTKIWNERIKTVRRYGLTRVAPMIVERWFTSSFPTRKPTAYQGYVDMLQDTPPMGYTGTCEAIRDADLNTVAGLITQPTLVVCGSEDITTPPDQGRKLSGIISDARFEIIQDAGHLPCLEQPSALAGLIQDFLKEQSYG